MYEDQLIMPNILNIVKIYGHGAADVLRQAEIKAKFTGEGLSIATSKDQVLVITVENGKLKFYLKTEEVEQLQ